MRTKQFSIVYSVVGLDSFQSKRVIYMHTMYKTSNFEFDAKNSQVTLANRLCGRWGKHA